MGMGARSRCDGGGYLVNAARCRRLHCYVTGPLYLRAALYVVLSAFGLVVLHPDLFLIVVLVVSCLPSVRRFRWGGTRREHKRIQATALL